MDKNAMYWVTNATRAYIYNNFFIEEPHRQACGTSCYAQTGDILSKEHSPTAKTVMLCAEGLNSEITVQGE